MKTIKLFVYGTLKRGGSLNSWLNDSTLLGTAQLMGYALANISDIEGTAPSRGPRKKRTVYEFPAMYDGGSPEHVVEGEVYSVPEVTFEHLRAMEERAGYLTVKLSYGDGDELYYFILPIERESTPGTYRWDVTERTVEFTPKPEGCGCEEPQRGAS